MSSTFYFDQAILDHAFLGNVYTQPANLYMALYSTSPDSSGAGTELSAADGYARAEITFAAANANIKISNATANFTCTGNAWATVVAAAIVDDSTGGNILIYDSVSPARTLQPGATLTFESGDVTVTLD